jgi:hypothetical protein
LKSSDLRVFTEFPKSIHLSLPFAVDFSDLPQFFTSSRSAKDYLRQAPDVVELILACVSAIHRERQSEGIADDQR